MNYYKDKSDIYFGLVREDIIHLAKRLNLQNLKILEIGSAGADTLIELKNRGYATEIVGIELFKIPNSLQDSPIIDKFLIADIENEVVDLPMNYFDLIICADVLEHLNDPWNIVDQLTKYLKNGGHFIASLPNIRHYTSLYSIIIKSDFRYAGSGILDKTHLRFFCKKNIIELLTTKYLQPIYVAPSFSYCPYQKKRKKINSLTMGIFRDLLAQQYLVISHKYLQNEY